MSYRSFKRVLGETSLERKCRFLFGACLLSLITGSFWWYSKQTDDLVLESSQRTGRGLVAPILIEHHWRKLDTTGEEWKDFLPTLSKGLATENHQWDFIRPQRDTGNQPQDDFEERVRNLYLNAPKPGPDGKEQVPTQDRRLIANGKAEYHYYQPIRAKQECILCHESMSVGGVQIGELKLDDLLAIVKVVLPDEGTQKALNWNRVILLTTAIITVFLAMIASYIIVRYVIVKPLKHLRDVSDEISHGNTSMRADIHTGDEFEEMGLAFNRMVRHLTTIQDELREVNGNFSTKVDELAQANMRLYEMNRLKSDFLATMSHELRTPLNAIIGFSDVLESIDSLDDKQKRYVRNIQKSGRVLLEMINDILDLAKIESGKMEVRLSDFRIDQVLHAQCDMSRPLTERKNIDLTAEIEPDLPDMFQDQAKVQQILNNLLSNAIKFTPEGGRIVTSATRDTRGDLVLTVTDTGVGIANEDQVAIFEKFRQGKSTMIGGDAMTREYSGTGLGLSIVKELCKLLGGEISLESEVGKGSTFTVRLPWTRPDQPKFEAALPTSLEELSKARREPGRADEPVASSAGRYDSVGL